MNTKEQDEISRKKGQEGIEDRSDSKNQNLGRFEIEDFLRSNYKLFAILGVFGAISVYLPKIGSLESNLFLRVGFVSTLFLILLTALIIDRRFFLQVGRTMGLVKSFLHPTSDTYEMVLFFIPFNALAISLITISGSYTATLAYLFQFIGVSFGVAFAFHTVKILAGRRDTEGENSGDENQNLVVSIIAFIFLGLVLLTIGGKGIDVVKSTSVSNHESLFTFTPELGISAVWESLFFGIGLAGLIYWVLAIVITVYMILKLLDKMYKLVTSVIAPHLPIRN